MDNNERAMFKRFMESLDDDCKKATMMRFETEDAAIEYAVKCAKLKPGDIVYKDGKQKAVFRDWIHEDNRAFLFMRKEDGRLVGVACPASAFTFEPVAEKEMPESVVKACRALEDLKAKLGL